jgi:hypothetical protein
MMDVDASMQVVGIIVVCVGGYIVAAVRQDTRRSRRRRLAEILGYLLILSGSGFFIAGLIRPD